MYKAIPRRTGSQAGFTLVELIVVIVILGIMAATALPKFVDTGTEARVAKMQAAAGALKSGAAAAKANWLVKNNGTGTTTTMEGVTITVNASGFPNAATIDDAAGISSPDYQLDTTTTAGSLIVTPDTDHDNCSVTYNSATGVVTVSADSTTCA